MLLSLFWRRLNYEGAVAGIISGFVVSILWLVLFNCEYYGFNSLVYNTQLYEIVPGFIVGLIVAVVVALSTKKPEPEVLKVFDAVKNSEE
jgi:sodium/proline symporter